jgi:hypothetical protein
VGPPPAAALTLTTGLPGDSPAFPVRRTLRGCLVPRTTTEPQRNLATGTLLRPQAEAPLPAAEGPALGRSLRKRAPCPDRSGRTAPGRIHACHSRFSRVPGPLAASGACAIIFHNIAGRFPRLSKGQGKRQACHGQRRGHAAGSSHVLQSSHTPSRPSNATRAFRECRSGITE